MARIIAICGKICSGKTCYANRLREKEKAVLLSCDELTKELFDNQLGDAHDEMACRIWNYFKKKSVELVRIGCNVILDWGFWSRESRESLTAFCREQNVSCEWHYLDVDDLTWQENIAERNRRIEDGRDSQNYYLDEGLKNKLLSRWEPPAKEEIDVWYTPDKKRR